MRIKIIAGNWKMNGAREEAATLARAVAKVAPDPRETIVVVCPPFTALATVKEALTGSPVNLGAQNMHWEPKGAFTGEISAAMLKENGCSYVILGHSERRHIMGESDDMIAKKLKTAIAQQLIPILCVGELLAERESGRATAVVERQCDAALASVAPETAAGIVVAYEPVWAIGTGKNATPQEAQEMHRFIRQTLTKRYGGEIAGRIRILYGGSVTADNAKTLLTQPDVDGVLVGGASLKADAFAAIIRSAR